MNAIHRRDVLKTLGLSLAGYNLSGWMSSLVSASEAQPTTKHCILLWMPGGASQIDTFDMKPEHANGGEFQTIDTKTPGVQISEHLPKLAGMSEHLAIVRSLTTAEGDHNRGTFLMHTGHRPGGPIRYPTIGSSLSKSLGKDDAELPNFISISPYTAFSPAAYGPGFLGPRHAPLTVGATNAFQQPQQTADYADLGVDDLQNPTIDPAQAQARVEIWNLLQGGFLQTHASGSAVTHNTVHERAMRMMRGKAAAAFDLSQEPETTRDKYGRGRFGQGCLMARRLVERGVPFIEVALRGSANGALGWDTHTNNFARVKDLSQELDAGWSALMEDLQDRGLLESTTIIWLSEFGRTPEIRNRGGSAGRDHYPRAWTTVLAGGGIQGGQAYGKTSADGTAVVENPVDVPDVFATLCRALDVDPGEQNLSELGRPIRIAEGKPIEDILA